MKKIFTLITVACMAVTANAQGTYAVDTLETISVGSTISSVNNITMTYGGDASTGDASAGIGKSAFTDGDAPSTVFIAYYKGNGNNPKDADGKGFDASGNLPVKGTYYILKPTIAGNIKVAVVFNSGKKFFIVEDGKALTDFNGITTTAKYTGTYSFPVKANSTYYVFCIGSKLGFGGFTLTAATTNITDISTGESYKDAPTFNLAGQKVNKTYKGVVIQNGKKIINK